MCLCVCVCLCLCVEREWEIGPVGDGGGGNSHTHSVANERGITTWLCLIGPLFCNQNGWLHSDVIRTWVREAGGRSTASVTRFYWIVVQWASDDEMFSGSLVHSCKTLIHKPSLRQQPAAEEVVRHFITAIVARVPDKSCAVAWCWKSICALVIYACLPERLIMMGGRCLRTEGLIEIWYCFWWSPQTSFWMEPLYRGAQVIIYKLWGCFVVRCCSWVPLCWLPIKLYQTVFIIAVDESYC